MKMKINDKEYLLCDCCGAFKSCERCYNCKPLQATDTNICEVLKPYYENQKEQKIFKVKHHLLEYYFTSEQLIDMGLYFDVPDWQILTTDNLKHSKVIKGRWNLHKHLYKDEWENYKGITEQEVRELINNIPKQLIDIFRWEE